MGLAEQEQFRQPGVTLGRDIVQPLMRVYGMGVCMFRKKTTCLQEFRFLAGRWFFVKIYTAFVWEGYNLEAEEAAAFRLSLTTRMLSSKQSSQTFKFPTLSLYSGLPHTEHSRS